MATVYELPVDLQSDLDQFREEVQKLNRGAVSAAEFRAFRVPRGVYEQRESDTYMLRVRFPAGIVLPQQLRVLAQVSQRYGNGVLHVTTRQDIQIHRLLLDDIHPALVELLAAGMSSKGGGGNTVRNITGCCNAGVCAEEAFDPSGYILSLTGFLLPDPLSYQLPRKYKIAVSGCSRDCAGATINDLGLIAKQQDGVPGFAVYVAGGMGGSPRVADRLETFVPAGQVHLVAEAVKRVFDQHGNRRNRQKARLRFLVEQIGLARFRELYQKELVAVRKAVPEDLVPRPLPNVSPVGPVTPSEPVEGFAPWRERHAVPQKQPEYHRVTIPLSLGDIEAGRLTRLADVVAGHGEQILRATQRQNLVLRFVHLSELPSLHAELKELGLAGQESPVIENLVACTGAATCRLGICLSRGLASAIRDEITGDGLDLDRLGDLTINISGCPNACGRHPAADIGLFGAARRAHGRLVPHYVLQLGGRLGEGRTRLAEGQQFVPARNVPLLVKELLTAFEKSPQCPDFAAFLESGGRKLADSLAAKHQQVPEFAADPRYYIDWSADELFSLAGRGPGECGAGVFDLIEVDLQSAADALAKGRLFDATILAARALLVTRGQQANSPVEALDLFGRYFIAEKLVDSTLVEPIVQARRSAQSENPGANFLADPRQVTTLVEAVQQLYAGMDASLRFKPVGQEPAPAAAASSAAQASTQALVPDVACDKEVDFRGVVCPLNYVRTKLVLDQLSVAAVLSVLLDEPGSHNVPESVQKDGHEVLSVDRQDDHWKVVIRKRMRDEGPERLP
jgi:sulfite reductase (ferredoxin)